MFGHLPGRLINPTRGASHPAPPVLNRGRGPRHACVAPREHATRTRTGGQAGLALRETPAFERRQGVYGSTPVPPGMTP